jgi:type IV fimbrial biogenesis protein FimT
MNKQQHAGFTLLETMMVIAITSILAAIALPSYKYLIETNNLEKAVESLKSDMQFARTQAIKRSANVTISRTTGDAGAWCYGLTTKSSCDCAETDTAAADYCEIKIVSGSGYSTTNMDSDSGNIEFDSRRGTTSNNGVTFSTDGYEARVIHSAAGRIRICIPDSASDNDKEGLPGKPDCD